MAGRMVPEMRRLGRFVPRSRRVLVPLGVVGLLVVLVGGYFTAYAMPRSRAAQMISSTGTSVVALSRTLDRVSTLVEQQKALYAESRKAMTGEVARQLQLNARDGRLAAQTALDSVWHIMLLINSYGKTVQVGGIPILMGDDRVSFARENLTGRTESWGDLEQALRTMVRLFDQAEKTAPIMRDFLPYEPAIDLGTRIELSTKPVVLLRTDSTLAALDMSITQISQLSPPSEMWESQERWLKQFVISRALLTEIQQYVMAEDFRGAEERVEPYASVVEMLQNDMMDTVEEVWSRLPAADTLQTARGWLSGMVTFVEARD